MSIESQIVAWVLSAATAFCFGWLAHMKGRNRFAWAFGGWALGLVTATVLLGLAEASFIPISPNGYLRLRIEAAFATILVIVGVSALFARARVRT